MSTPSAPFLPYGRQTIENDDVAAVVAVLKGDYLTTGPAVEAFEAALAARTGAGYAVVCASGTAALHMAALALGLGPGDAVVVPSLTFLATANAARFVGAEVVFADVDPETGLMGPEHVEAALSRVGDLRPRAVLPVHLNGQPADMAGIGAVARRHGLAVVEDACHALGGTAAGAPVGSCSVSDMACFSTHPVKAIATGEGGLITTNDPVLAERLRGFRTHGMVRDPGQFRSPDLGFAADGSANPWYYEMHEPGLNYRLSDINCALGLSQLGKLDRFLARRRAVADLYDRLLAPLAPVVRPVPRVGWGLSGWHLYAVLVDYPALGLDRAAFMTRLRDQGIGTQVHYLPVHLQPYYSERYGAADLPGAARYYAQVLSLPLYPGLSDAEVARVADTLAALVGAGDVSLRHANAADSDMILGWQSAPGIRRYARNPGPPTAPQHAAWFAAVLADPARELFVIEQRGTPVGILRLDTLARDRKEVSILVAPDRQGRGIGRRALHAMKLVRGPFEVFAAVNRDNAASHAIFRAAGFMPSGEDYLLPPPSAA